jgi:hypothetical protein
MDKTTIDSFDALVRWVATLAGALLIPLLLLLLLIWLMNSKGAPDRIERLLKPFGSVKLLGAELVLRDPEKLSRSAEDAFRSYRAETKTQFDELVKKFNIDALHRKVVDEWLAPKINGIEAAAGFRSTIHVSDTLFAESYYQLLPYYPGGTGEARSWSVRFGLVGKTWRMGESACEGTLQMSSRDLVTLWGMTSDEADEVKTSRPALIAVVLRDARQSRSWACSTRTPPRPTPSGSRRPTGMP